MTTNSKPLTDSKEGELQQAISWNRPEMIYELYEQGYDLNSVIWVGMNDYKAGIFYAIHLGRAECVSALVDCKVDIEQKDSWGMGHSALNYAAFFNNASCAKILIDAGADVNSTNNNGDTPLMTVLTDWCWWYGENSDDVVKALLRTPDLDVNITDLEGLPAISYILRSGNTDLAKEFVSHDNFDEAYNMILMHETPLFNEYMALVGDSDQTLLNEYLDAKHLTQKFDIDTDINFAEFNDHQSNVFHFKKILLSDSILSLCQSYEDFYSNVLMTCNLPEGLMFASTEVYQAVNFTASFESELPVTPELSQAFLEAIQDGNIAITPTGSYEHCTYVVFTNDTFYACNRGERSDGIHGITEYHINNPENLTVHSVDNILYTFPWGLYLLNDMPEKLGLEFIEKVENPAQVVENSAWTSAETAIEAAYIAAFKHQGFDNESSHLLAKDMFHVWEEYDMSVALYNFVDHKDFYIANDMYGPLAADIILAHHDINNSGDIYRATALLNEMTESSVTDAFYNNIAPYMIAYDPSCYKYISFMDADLMLEHDADQNYSLDYGFQYNNFSNFYNYFFPSSEVKLGKELCDFMVACDEFQQGLDSPLLLTDVINLSTNDALDVLMADYQQATLDNPAVTPFTTQLNATADLAAPILEPLLSQPEAIILQQQIIA